MTRDYRITVRALIAQLRKLPPDAKIAWCDHDHDSDGGEMNSAVHSAQEAPEALRARGYGVVLR